MKILIGLVYRENTHIHNKYMYTIRAYYSSILWELCSAQTTPDDGHRTRDAVPSTPYYKLTGELKNWSVKCGVNTNFV